MDGKKPNGNSVKEFLGKYGALLIALGRLAYEVTNKLWNDGGPGSRVG
jgi:hypothetical protein